MTVRTGARAIRGVVPAVLAAAILVAGCGDSAAPRPTDPRKILTDAVAATAVLPSLRLHVEIASLVAGFDNQPNQQMTMAIDLDVDLPTRQFAGRSTMQMPQMAVNNGGQAQQVSDIIVTQAGTFTRNSATGRWVKIPAAMLGFGGGPTNAQVAAMIATLVSNPSIALELGEAAACTLGTCDHVLARVDGHALGSALAPLVGIPIDAAMGSAIPNFDVDILVDQATSVLSEMRSSITMDGGATRILLTLSNPGQPVQIVAPPAALTDDFGMGGGFGGGMATPAPFETGILEEVGNGLETPWPADPESPTP